MRLKSDRPGRALIAALWITPVVLPFVAAGASALVRQSQPAPAPVVALRPAQDVVPSKPAPSAPFVIPVLPGDGLLQGASPILPAARLEAPKAEAAAPKPSAPQPRVRISGAHVLRNVTPLDGLRLGADGLVIQLDGIAPAPEGKVCTRLDGVAESCAQRALARLDILTRGRPVTCDVRDAGRGDPMGTCRAGKIDLADDLIKNGLAIRKPL